MFRTLIFMFFAFSGLSVFAGALPSPGKQCFDECIGKFPGHVNKCLVECGYGGLSEVTGGDEVLVYKLFGKSKQVGGTILVSGMGTSCLP